MTTLSCAGMSTLVGLYKSKPTDLNVARVGIHTVGSVFKHGSFVVSIFVIVFSYVTFFITKPYTSIYITTYPLTCADIEFRHILQICLF